MTNPLDWEDFMRRAAESKPEDDPPPGEMDSLNDELRRQSWDRLPDDSGLSDEAVWQEAIKDESVAAALKASRGGQVR